MHGLRIRSREFKPYGFLLRLKTQSGRGFRLMGRELQRQLNQTPQVVMTMPLIEGLDGVKKMSKSLGNYIAIEDPPGEMFGKLMSISDELMWRYYELLSLDTSVVELERMQAGAASGAANPQIGRAHV